MATLGLQNARVALLSCGSFNPPTFMHLRMFERARDLLQFEWHCHVVEGIMSPVADHYGKAELLPAHHRLRMCELAVKSSSWIRADGWECSQNEWTRTRVVLEHHLRRLQDKYGAEVRLILLCGADVVDSFAKLRSTGEPLWKAEDISQIFSDYGVVCLQRHGATARSTLDNLPVTVQAVSNVLIVEDDTFPNELSSTRLRSAVRLGHSIRYCTSDSVVDYIKAHNLYKSSAGEPCASPLPK